MNHSKSLALYEKACLLMPAGVNSPVRAFKNVESFPFFVDHAKGAYLTDIDGNTYIDFVNSWGALILGHGHPMVIEAVIKALENGTSYGTPHPAEVEFAELIHTLMPSLDQIRLVNSGTEAAMSVIRLARGHTGKKKIIKFEGCYHGASDSLLVKAGSGLLTFGLPDSAGIPESFAAETLVARFNDLDSVSRLFEQFPQEIGALIIEPIAGNMNFIPPLPDFLLKLRQLCDQHKALLIFDEVMTGFRVALGGAQSLYNVKPDLTILAKVIGGGFPLAALGGRKEIMDKMAPQGPIYQAGTLSGNPIAIAAGLATLRFLASHPESYEKLDHLTHLLLTGLMKKAQKWNIPFFAQFQGSMFGFYFIEEQPIHFYDQIKKADKTLFTSFFHGMLNQGVYFAPSSFEAGFTSLALTSEEVEKVIEAADKTFKDMTESYQF